MQKNNSIIIFSLMIFLFAFSQCNQINEKEEPVSDINPNGSSELSLLMRIMFDSANEMKRAIEQKTQPVNFPEEFLNIKTVKPTDENTKKPSYDAFADQYISSLRNIVQSGGEDLVYNYNSMINACLNCHSDHCPGPVPKIKKLLILTN